MKIQFIPIDYDYFDYEGRNYARIIGRDENGKRICLVDEFLPHLWAIFKDKTPEKKVKEISDKVRKIKVEVHSRISKVEKVEIHKKNFLGNEVTALKIFITNFKDAHDIADEIGFPEIEFRREYDLGFKTKYILEKKLIPLNWYELETSEINSEKEFGGILKNFTINTFLKLNKIIKSEDKKFSPKILAFDIESDELEIGKGEIVLISLVSENFKKVLTCKKSKKIPEYVEYFKTEKEMIEKFVEYTKKISPDILTGYFSDGFDLPYLRARAEYNKIKLNLGLDNSQPTFSRGKIPAGSINGIVHVDLFRFIEKVYSQYLQSETLGLNEVASEILGEGKKEFKFKHSSKITEDEWQKYFEYNLHDSILTYNLSQKFWPEINEFCKIIQEPLFDLTRDGMSSHVENYVLHHLEDYNEIAEKRPVYDEISGRQELGKYEGAFVLQPVPNLYENIVFFDFTSMYSSIIVSYNLSKTSLVDKKDKNTTEVELENQKVYFSKEKAFFPSMLNEIINKRKEYKTEYKKNPSPINKARSNAYKLLANASYGYQGFFGARYYCREAAASTAALAKKSILETIEKIKSRGYEIIYSDTDSIAFLQGKKTKKDVLEMLDSINDSLPGIMELDLEDFYKRGIWVSKRTTEIGAKKKYALIDEKGKIKIRGFETIRRDWCQLARELQNEVLELILNEGNEKRALEIVKKKIKELKERKISREEILIRTQLKKSISEYKSITPHVVAAQRMKEKGIPVDMGMLMEYFIAETSGKKELVRDKVRLADESGDYDMKYYLEKQLLPAVENIFQVFKINLQENIQGNKQTTLNF